MINYYKAYLNKKNKVKDLVAEKEKLEIRRDEISHEMIKAQTRYTKTYNEIISLKGEDEEERVSSGMLMANILLIMFAVLGVLGLKSIGVSVIKIILVLIFTVLGGTFITYSVLKTNKTRVKALKEANTELIAIKTEELERIKGTIENIYQDLKNTLGKIGNIDRAIKLENMEIAELERLIDNYLAPFMVSQIDQAISHGDKEANMALARIAKHLEGE